MCLTTLGTIVDVGEGVALVEIDGIRRRAGITLHPDVGPGDIVLVGLGLVLGRVDGADRDALMALQAEGTRQGDVP